MDLPGAKIHAASYGGRISRPVPALTFGASKKLPALGSGYCSASPVICEYGNRERIVIGYSCPWTEGNACRHTFLFLRNCVCSFQTAMKPHRTKQPRKSKPRRSQTRRRRSAEEARSEALASARKLLMKQGPGAVTLKAVADDAGMGHTNLLHHFGTAGELQSELMSLMVRDLAGALMDVVADVRSDAAVPRALVDRVFDAFGNGGAGILAAWIVLSGDLRHLKPVRTAVAELVAAIEEKFPHDDGDVHTAVTSAVLFVALMAFGDSVIGEPLKAMLKRDPLASRKVAAFLLPALFSR